MSDVDYVLQIIAKLRDETGPGLESLKAKINSMKASQDAENAEKDLGKAIDDRGRKEDEARKKSELSRTEREKGRRATDDSAASTHDAADAAEREEQAHQKTGDTLGNLGRAREKHNNGLGNQVRKTQDVEKSAESLIEVYDRLGKKEDELNKNREQDFGTGDLKKRRQELLDLASEYTRVNRGMRKEDLDNATAREAADRAERARAEASQLRVLSPASRQPLEIDTAAQAAREKAVQAESDAQKDLELRTSKSRVAWNNFKNDLDSGSLSKGEASVKVKQFASELRGLARETEYGSESFKNLAKDVDSADKYLKKADFGASGKSTGPNLSGIKSDFDDLGIRITGVSSFLRGFFDLAKIGFSQQLITGVVSLAGGLVSLASAAAQAGAALAGAFVSGMGQAIPMLSIVIASVERFKSILQAVSVAGQAEQQKFYDPTEKQVTQLQNTSQLISSQQQLSNSYIQLYEAQQRVRDSQIALTEARYTAQRQITELANAEKNARLEAEGADLSLVEAKRQLQIAIQKGNATGLQQAELAVKEAELNKKKSEYEIPKAEREARLARQRGVSGAPSVISAVEGLEGAKVAELQASQAGEAAKRQEQITQLQQAARSSKETQYEAQLKFLEKGMSPTELGLTNSLIAIEKELKSPDSPLKKITDYFVEPFANAIERIRSLLKSSSFLGPIDELAKSMGAGLSRLEKATYGKGGTSFFETMATDAAKNIPVVTGAIEGLMKLFEKVAEAADPAFHKLSEDWDRFWAKLNIKYDTPEGFKALENFFNKSVEYAEAFGKLGVALGGLFKAIGHDAAPQGKGIVEGLTGSIKEATTWVQSHGPEVTKFFREAKEGLSLIAEVLMGIGIAMIKVFNLTSLSALKNFLTEVILPSLQDIITVLGKGTTIVLDFFNAFGTGGRKILEVIGVSGLIVFGIVKIIGVIEAVKKVWAAFILLVEGTSWTALTNPILAALALVGTAVAVVFGAFSSKQKENKLSTEEVTQALEAQASAIRAIKDLNAEYKSSELGVKESKASESEARRSLKKTEKEKIAPAEGESQKEADESHSIRVERAKEQVERTKISREEAEHRFKELPKEQRETVTRSGISSEKSLNELRKNRRVIAGEAKGLESNLHEEEEVLGKPSKGTPDYKFLEGIRDKIITKNKELKESEEKLGIATNENSERVKKSSEVISQSTEKAAKIAPKISEAYKEAFDEFGVAIRSGVTSAGSGMSKIHELVDKALKKYGVSPAEVSSPVTNVETVLGGIATAQSAIAKAKGHASGAYISAASGGHIARVGEGGHDEVVLTTDPAQAPRQRQLLGQYFSRAPHMAAGGPVGYESPFHGAVNWGRSDQGTDVDLTPGSPITAIGDAKIKGIISNWYQQQPFIWYELLNGLDKGKYVYIAEQINKLATVGKEVKAGQPVAYYAPSGTGIETGWATASGATLASATSGYKEGEATPAGKAFTAFLTGLQHGKVVAGGIGEAVNQIISPKIKGGGAIGQVAQGALNMATKAANIYMAKQASALGGHHTLESGKNFPAGQLGPANKQEFAKYLAEYTGLPVKFLGAWINHEQGNSTVEGGNNWLNIETGGPGGGSGPYGATAKWAERHSPKQAALIEAEWLKHNLPQLLRAKSASEAVSILENSGYAESHYGNESPEKFLSAYAAGGMVGSSIRRLAIRHLRKKVLRFAQGGIAPWGGRPIPVIAHEGERIMNPAQYGETARLAGTSPGGLDRHLGYDSSPRQSFAAGGIPKVISQSAQETTGTSGSFSLSNINKEIAAFNILLSDPGSASSIKEIAKIFKVISEGFKKLKSINKNNEEYSTEMSKFVKSIVEESLGVLAKLKEGREIVKSKLEKGKVEASYGSKHGVGIVLKPGGETAIEERDVTILAKEGSGIQKEANLVSKSMSSVKSGLAAADKMSTKTSAERNKRASTINALNGYYAELIKKQRELTEEMNSNIEARYQAESQALQDKLTETNNAYQTVSAELSTKTTSAQALGNLGELIGLQGEAGGRASEQKSRLEPILNQAKAVGDKELVASIEQEMSSLQQTINNAIVEQINTGVQMIQRESQLKSSQLSAKQTAAQTFGNIEEIFKSGGIDEQIINNAKETISQLQGSLMGAEAAGDTAKSIEIKEAIIGLETTIITTTAGKITAAQELIQRESTKAESQSGMRLGISKVLVSEGKYIPGGEEEKVGLGEKHTNLLSVRGKEEALREQAIREGDTTAVITLGEELNKNSVEIAENNLALKENAVVVRELIVSQIEAKGQFQSGIYSAAQQGLEIIGKTTGFTNVAGMIAAAKGKEKGLGEERSGLEEQAGGIGLGVNGMTPAEILTYLASPAGQNKISEMEKHEDKGEKESMYKLIQALETNATNTLKNAEEIARLNGQLNQPQSFSTAAFSAFRNSFFTGMGGLLPTYSSALPPGARPEGMPVYGSGQPGAPVGGTHIGQISLTHPVEKLDPSLFGEELSYHIATTPPSS
jgi:hypothetical protein